ncbi:MAG: ATP-binding protein [Clostridiaceae bacterium]
MKKKLMISMISILTISILIVTFLFISIEGYQNEKYAVNNLKINNDIAYNLINENEEQVDAILKKNYRKVDLRVTYIDSTGKVVGDSDVDISILDSHYNREEIKKARQKNSGYSIRKSDTTGLDMLYYATELDNGYYIRSSMQIENGISINKNYITYYVITIIAVLALAIAMVSKVSYYITRPIEELKFVTSKIADGDLNRKSNIVSDDEIGELSKIFNVMTEKLKNTIEDTVDKQNKIEAILKSMDSGVIAVDVNYKILMFNPFSQRMFEIEKNVIGENLVTVIKDLKLTDIIKNRNNEYVEYELNYPIEKIIRIKTTPVINGNTTIGWVTVMQDITDIKRLENLRSQFVANVSHELKTPLTSIKGFAETLKDVDDQNTRIKFLNIINEESDRLTRLINDILILSDLENMKEIECENIYVERNIENVFNLMKKGAADKNINLINEGNCKVYVKGNEDKFKQMLINLIDNAIKYTDNNGEVKIISEILDDRCVISIVDNGIGIGEKHVNRLFERFYRADKARSRARGGTGLGLAIVKHIVISMDGNIRVESKISKGSKFIVSLPIYEVD